VLSKKILPCLLACLISVIPLGAEPSPKLDADGLPAYEYSTYLMQTQPELVWQMVRKLYSLEHSTPTLELPGLMIVETKTGDLKLGYYPDAVASLGLGNLSYKIEYKIELKPAVLAGFRPAPEVSLWWYVGGGAVLFLGGFVAGLMSR